MTDATPTSRSPLRILVYSDDARTRRQVRAALGVQVHPDLPDLEYVEVATPAVVLDRVGAGDIDLAVLDGEAAPAGGMGLTRQLGDELERRPPVVLLLGRPDDAWLARWSGAEATVLHPVDPLRLGREVVKLLEDRIPSSGSAST